MYKVYCDSYLLYDDSLESLKIFNPQITMELNVVGSFTFTIYPNHPYFEHLHKMKSIIKVYQDGLMIFKGRILNDVNGFHNEKQVTCESDLSFLLDSIQRPYQFQGTPTELLSFYIERHNAEVDEEHQFTLGNVTVTDPNDYINRSSSEYPNTFDEIKSKLIEKLGGYIWIRHEEDGSYIDYLEDFNWLSNQTIEFGKNLLDYSKTIKADEIFTVIIPIGATIQDEQGNDAGKLTIAEVNDGKDYLINEDAAEIYGKIVRMIEWSDVTLPTNLKTKAQSYLDNSVLLANTIELTAADLSGINQNINAFHIGTKVRVISKPHNVDALFLVNKLSLDLLNPANSKLQMGASYLTMTESQANTMNNIASQIEVKVESSRNDIINVVSKQMQSSIESSSDQILSTVAETYYNKGETNQIIDERTTQMSQTIDGWEQRWTSFQIEYAGDKQGTEEQFAYIEKYIRYVDGKIIIGEVGNELELRIGNDRISFYQNNTHVAYFTNNRLFVVDGEFTNSLQLGVFAFLPRTNGNLSFKKVGYSVNTIRCGENIICGNNIFCGQYV